MVVGTSQHVLSDGVCYFAQPLISCFQSRNLYQIMCVGCDAPCEGCYFENVSRVPYCEGAMPHSISNGRATTIETLSILPAYWRATSISKTVLPCYFPDACRGGVTGTPTYCQKGYEGPCELASLCFVLAVSEGPKCRMIKREDIRPFRYQLLLCILSCNPIFFEMQQLPRRKKRAPLTFFWEDRAGPFPTSFK